ncbi:MAG TPA: septum formation family protein [Acidimicrobiales bacterium]
MNAPAPGWNPDPTGRHEYRYWDGSTWTDDVSDSGVTSVDPVGGPAAPGVEPTAPFEPTQQYGPQPTQQYGPQPGQPAGPQPGAWGQQPGAPGAYGPYGSGQVPPATPPKSGPPKGLIIGLVVAAVAVIAAVAIALAGGDDDGETSTDDTSDTTGDTSSDTTSSDTTGDTASDTTAGPEDADVFTLAVGDCLVDDTRDGEVQSVPVVPCDQPHASEIFYSHIIDADTLPSSTEMEAIVDEQCIGNFESFVGLPYPDSVLEVTWLEPTQESWDAGDRELLCMVVDPAGDVTGSLEGANR